MATVDFQIPEDDEASQTGTIHQDQESLKDASHEEETASIPRPPQPTVASESEGGSQPDDDRPDLAPSSGVMEESPTRMNPPPVLEELQVLRERLAFLENCAIRQLRGSRPTKPTEHKGKSLENQESWLLGAQEDADDEAFRRHIRKAPSAKQLVAKAEKLANKTADERKEYGTGSPPGTTPGYAINTMRNIGEDGGYPAYVDDQSAVITQWGRTHSESAHDYMYEYFVHQHGKPSPHGGIRPVTSLKPFYAKPNRDNPKWIGGQRVAHPLQLSGKLGPPSKWDQSDSEEWSSDTSTQSKDFKYFRARLRGDFEWELDRLNAQILRFKKHRDKQNRKIFEEKQKRRHQQMAVAGEKLGTKNSTMDGPKILIGQMSWSEFKLGNFTSGRYAVDVLVEEPRLAATPFHLETNAAVGVTDMSTIDGADPEFKRKQTTWTAETHPLPERIRINSRQIIELLTSIHGSELCPNSKDSTSLIMLRPFRMLSLHQKEIREAAAKLKSEVEGYLVSSEESDANQGVAGGAVSSTGDDTEHLSKEDDKGLEDTAKAIPRDKEEIEERKAQIDCLCDFMDEYIEARKSHLKSSAFDKAFFSDVWYLFQPGTYVISADGKQAFRVVNLHSKRHQGVDRWTELKSRQQKTSQSSNREDQQNADVSITCIFIHFDGYQLGPVLETFELSKWEGAKNVTDLDIYPFRFRILKMLRDQAVTSSTSDTPTEHLEQELDKGIQVMREKLIKRGQMFVDVAGVKHMYYAGLALGTHDEIESQVMIDFAESFAHEDRKEWRPDVESLVGMDWSSKSNQSDKVNKACEAECCWGQNVHDDAYVDVDNTKKLVEDFMTEMRDTPQKLPSAMMFPRSLEDTKNELNALTDDELMIMSHSVFGFVLRDRTWAQLDLNFLTEVVSTRFATEAVDEDVDNSKNGSFGQLILPKGHKEMVLSLISQHFRSKKSQTPSDKEVDIVRGKGKGLILLLHGAPGVGKTTTAEGVADTFRKPLFQITCGDLGSTPKEVETALQTSFALASRWGCILLLDEADVFLAERRREDFNRNGLVAVFLRVLEYYSGILFLTTNRIGDFDEAFASRIHMSLHYPALDRVSTAKVFRLNLNLIKDRFDHRIQIEEDEIIDAARDHWNKHEKARLNGRQIRNACQTALALAEYDAQPPGKKYDIKEKSTNKIHLMLSHMEIVFNSYLKFTEYLNDVHRADSEMRAYEAGLRAGQRGRQENSDDRASIRGLGTGLHLQDASSQSWKLQSNSSAQHHPPSVLTASTPAPTGHAPWPHTEKRPASNYESISSQGPYAQYRQQMHETSPLHNMDPRTPGLNATYNLAAQQYSGGMHATHGQYPSPQSSMPQSQGTVFNPSPSPGPSGDREYGGPSSSYYGGGDHSVQEARGGPGLYQETQQT